MALKCATGSPVGWLCSDLGFKDILRVFSVMRLGVLKNNCSRGFNLVEKPEDRNKCGEVVWGRLWLTRNAAKYLIQQTLTISRSLRQGPRPPTSAIADLLLV